MKIFTVEWTKRIELQVVAKSKEEARTAAVLERVDDWADEIYDVAVYNETEAEELGDVDQVVINDELKHLLDATEEEKIELGIIRPERKEGDIPTPSYDDPDQCKLF